MGLRQAKAVTFNQEVSNATVTREYIRNTLLCAWHGLKVAFIPCPEWKTAATGIPQPRVRTCCVVWSQLHERHTVRMGTLYNEKQQENTSLGKFITPVRHGSWLTGHIQWETPAQCPFQQSSSLIYQTWRRYYTFQTISGNWPQDTGRSCRSNTSCTELHKWHTAAHWRFPTRSRWPVWFEKFNAQFIPGTKYIAYRHTQAQIQHIITGFGSTHGRILRENYIGEERCYMHMWVMISTEGKLSWKLSCWQYPF